MPRPAKQAQILAELVAPFFAYRIDIGIWIFAFAGMSALMIAAITVSFQAFKAATANPVENLSYE